MKSGKEQRLKLNEFIKDNCPKLSKAQPLTEAQERILINDYGEQKIKDILLRIEAYDKRTYKSIYRTVKNWLKRQYFNNNNARKYFIK